MHVSEFECAIAKSQISRYIAGDRMSDETMKQLEEHIARCSNCKTMIDQRRKELIQLLNLEEKTPGSDPVKKETVKQTIARGKGLVEGALARKQEATLRVAPPTHAVIAAEQEVEDNVLDLSMALSGARKSKAESNAPLEVVSDSTTTTETVAPKPRRSLFKKKNNPDDSTPEAAPQQSLPDGLDSSANTSTEPAIEIPLFSSVLAEQEEVLGGSTAPEQDEAENPLIQAFLDRQNAGAEPAEPAIAAAQAAAEPAVVAELEAASVTEAAKPAKAPRKSIFETLKLARQVPDAETQIPQALSQAAKAPGGLGVYARPVLTSIALATVIGAMAFVAGNPTKLMGKKADAAGSEVFAAKEPVTNKAEEKNPKGEVWRKRRDGEKVSADELNAALTARTAKAVKAKKAKKAKATATAKTTDTSATNAVTGSKTVDPKKAAVIAQMKKARAARLARIKARKAAAAKNEVIAIKPTKKASSKSTKSTASTKSGATKTTATKAKTGKRKTRTAKKRTSTAAQRFVTPKATAPSTGIKVYDENGNPI